LERDVRAWVGALKGEGELSFLVSACWGRVDSHLAHLAEQQRADLLVLGTHQRGWAARVWQGSVSRGALQSCTKNVACIPRGAIADEAPSIARFARVLIPTDLSPSANAAISAGYGLVGQAGEVHLLHVVVAASGVPAVELGQRLHALIPPRAETLGIVTHVHVVDDASPWEGICHHASQLAVDAICMAAQGQSAAMGVLLGSQAEQVVRHASQPVLLVKPASA
jgi:nucleotide-binding universal stress UspA family protein